MQYDPEEKYQKAKEAKASKEAGEKGGEPEAEQGKNSGDASKS